MLARRQFQVKDYGVARVETHQVRNFLDLASAEQRARMGARKPLDHSLHAGCAGSGRQLRQFLERLLNWPLVPRQFYPNQNGAFRGPRQQALERTLLARKGSVIFRHTMLLLSLSSPMRHFRECYIEQQRSGFPEPSAGNRLIW